MRLLLAGYFGCGNLGDDAILLGFLQGIAGTQARPSVLSGNPSETHRLYGVHAVPRRERAAWRKAVEGCDALVFPGGSIFQDVTSVGSVLYYSQLVDFAKKSGKKVFLLGQGVGPVTSYFGKRWTRNAFESADHVSVRDAASQETLSGLRVSRPASLGADMAFMLPAPLPSDEATGFQVGEMRTVGILPRPFGKDGRVIELVAELSQLLFKANMLPVLIEMDRTEDGPLLNEIDKKMGGRAPSIRKLTTPMQLQARLARLDAVISVRLHGGLLASTVGVPPYMVSYDPKVAAFAAAMGLPKPPNLLDATAKRIFEGFREFYNQRDRYRPAVERRVSELAAQARASLSVLGVRAQANAGV